MEYFVIIYICLAKENLPNTCINIEKNPIVAYQTLNACKQEADRLVKELPIAFKEDGWRVDYIEAGCLEQPANKA